MVDLFREPRRLIDRAVLSRTTGRVSGVSGLSVVAEGLVLPVGSVCSIEPAHSKPIPAQVVAVAGDRATLMTLREPMGIAAGDPVVSKVGMQHVSVGRQMLGCVLDGLGRPIGGRTDFVVESHYPVFTEAPPALDRQRINTVLPTGIRSIDALHTVGGGQRLGIFAGTGVGKSVLMGMIAKYSAADVIVVALIGERGREVGDFLHRDLGEEAMKRSVLVVSTSDQSPVLRVRAAFVATAVAEYFRDLGRDVLLLMDSTTRMAMAQRQIGVSAGEPPTAKGYPPSVFSLLPKLLERSGRTSKGSVTGMYTVLVEGDDITEPVSDAVRGILDGHIWLSRDLANRGHYPAVAVLESISRVMTDVVDDEHRAAAAAVRRVLAVWADIEDMVNIGAYVSGTNIDFDVAVQMKPKIDAFLQQTTTDHATFAESRDRLVQLGAEVESVRGQLTKETTRRVVEPAT